MSADDLIREIRFQLVTGHRRGGPGVRIWDMQVAEARHEYLMARRNIRAQERTLVNSPEFRQLAAGYLRAHVVNPASELLLLMSWLAVLKHLTHRHGGPQVFAQGVQEQERKRVEILSALRSAADWLSDSYATKLKALADEIENSALAIRGYDIDTHIVSIENFGRRGDAATLQDGAWRGWFIRELRDHLPALEHFRPNEYAMMACLLTWAGINQVTPILVRSILKGGHT